MRMATTCELRRDGRLVARGIAEIRSYGSTWDVSLFATAGYDIERLIAGNYEICIADDVRHAVEFVSITKSSREIRLLGIGDPPNRVESRRLDDFALRRSRRVKSAGERDPATGR